MQVKPSEPMRTIIPEKVPENSRLMDITGRLQTVKWRPEPESNRRARICSPLRNHSAIGPRVDLESGALPQIDARRNHPRAGAQKPFADSGKTTREADDATRVLRWQYSCAIGGLMTQPDQSLSASAAMRRSMVESQLRTNDVNDPDVLRALLAVPREDFVPEARRAAAYTDRPVSLGGGRALNPPLATARLLSAADIQRGERVLLIGAATGYAAALLAQLGADVTALESDAGLLTAARQALAGVNSVTFVEGPLGAGHAVSAPYDLIFIDGAIEQMPTALTDQLRVDGRAVLALVDRGVTRLARGVRSAGGFGLLDLVDTEAVILPGFARPKTFAFSS
jgi:protein-L-isoaspartate(D-aspartate) O-methyltransferase